MRVFTEEHRAAISAAMKGKPSGRKGAVLTPEHRAKLSAASIGRRHSTETRARMSAQFRALPIIGECVYCGGPATTRDHVIPRAHGRVRGECGCDRVPACRRCNESKGPLTPAEWLADGLYKYTGREA